MSASIKHLVAGGALTLGQVVVAAATATAAATDTAYGITTSGADSGAPVPVCVHGLVRVQAGAAVTQGDALMPTSAGQAVTHDGADGSVRIGYAVEAATAQGDLIEVVFTGSTDASDTVTAITVAAANTAGALREFTTATVSAETANVITVTLAQNIAAADLWSVELFDAAMGTLAATAAFAVTETGAGAVSLKHATLESQLLTLSAGGAAVLTVTDVAGASGQDVLLILRPLEAAAGGVAGCSYFFTITFD